MWWTASSADIAALAERFRRTRRRRLVILGGPGTGKTTLAMQLLLHLLATRHEHHKPVPVLLPVAGWDSDRFPGCMTGWPTGSPRTIPRYARPNWVSMSCEP